MCLKPFPTISLINNIVKSVSTFSFFLGCICIYWKKALHVGYEYSERYCTSLHASGAIAAYKYNIEIACGTQENSSPTDFLCKQAIMYQGSNC